jgi:hypothetical protein
MTADWTNPTNEAFGKPRYSGIACGDNREGTGEGFSSKRKLLKESRHCLTFLFSRYTYKFSSPDPIELMLAIVRPILRYRLSS